MARGGEEVDGVVGEVDVDVAGRLGGVEEEGDVVFAGELADGAGGLDGAGDVGGVGEGDEFGVGGDGSADFVGFDQGGLGVDGESCDGAVAGVFEGAEGAEDGVVVDVGANGVGKC